MLHQLACFILIVFLKTSFLYSQPAEQPDSNITIPVTIKISGDVHIDSHFYPGIDAPAGSFYIRRARLRTEGSLHNFVDYRIQLNCKKDVIEFEDVFIAVTLPYELKFYAGRFKLPLGLEYLQSQSMNKFYEVSLASDLIPRRDVGGMVRLNLMHHSTEIEVGVFNGAMDGQSEITDVNNDKEIAARIFSLPFSGEKFSSLKNFGIGVAATFGKEYGVATNNRLAKMQTTSGITFFTYNSLAEASGDRWRVIPQLYYYYNRFGFMGEYAISQQQIEKQPSVSTFTNRGWMATLSFFLTNDESNYTWIKPKDPITEKWSGLGAWELVARVHQLSMDKHIFPEFAGTSTNATEATAYGAGINWYLNDNVRFNLYYEITLFKFLIAQAPFANDKVIATRMQINF